MASHYANVTKAGAVDSNNNKTTKNMLVSAFANVPTVA